MQLKVTRHLMDQARRDPFVPPGEGVNRRMVAEDVNDARHSEGVVVDALDGLRRKDRLAVRAGDAQSFLDVATSLRRRELGCFVTQRNPLPKLPQPWFSEFQFEFRLSG